MQDPTVIYQGRVIPKKGFRAWIYSLDNKTKLVNSWEEYHTEMSSGLWYSSKKDLEDKKPKVKESKALK